MTRPSLEEIRGCEFRGCPACEEKEAALKKLDSLRGGKPPTKSDLVSTKLVGEGDPPKEGT